MQKVLIRHRVEEVSAFKLFITRLLPPFYATPKEEKKALCCYDQSRC